MVVPQACGLTSFALCGGCSGALVVSHTHAHTHIHTIVDTVHLIVVLIVFDVVICLFSVIPL